MKSRLIGRGAMLAAAFLFILLTVSAPVDASEEKMDMISNTRDAFKAQVSLSEKERSMNEVKQVLAPYFTEKFSKKFMDANIVQTENGFQTFGSDAAPFFVPFFSYEDGKTKEVKSNEDTIYVMEEFVDDGEGPVSFEDGNQWVRWISTDDGWKIDEMGMGTPEDIMEPIKGENHMEPAKRTEGFSAMANHLMGNLFTSFSIYPFNGSFHLFG